MLIPFKKPTAMMRNLLVIVLGSILAPSLAAPLHAQSSKPQTYSFTEDPAMAIIAPTVVKVSRDGPKEVVDQIMPPSPGRPKEFHQHILYDFQAHKIYTKLVSDASVPCSVMDYSSPGAPSEFDVITGAADLMQGLTDSGKLRPEQVGSETVNGIAAKVFEVTSPQAKQGKAKIWLAEKGNYPLKWVGIGPDCMQQTVIEVKQLSFAKPPASTFTPPPGCQQIQGEATANGVHAEIGLGAEGSSGSKAGAKVTAVQLQPIHDYTGPCPARIRMVGTITTDGPGTVWYQFAAGKSDPGETLIFSAAGTQTVTHVMTFNLDPKFGNTMGGEALLQAIMEDQQGNHEGMGQPSNNADFSINCGPASAP
jgi:hypothetical protein